MRRGGGHHELHYNEPGGHLFGEKPLPKGQKRKWESWEYIWNFGIWGCFAYAGIGLYYKPDMGIGIWARAEAEKRLQEKGISLDYPHTESFNEIRYKELKARMKIEKEQAKSDIHH